MARQLRIEFKGAYYHVLSRGNNQSNIFHSDEDRQDFLYILADMSERFEVEIYAYVALSSPAADNETQSFKEHAMAGNTIHPTF